MKREWPPYRGMASPAPFVRPSAEDQFEYSARTGQQRRRTKKIFVIKNTTRLRSTSAADKKIRRILIFDSHPESLRLVFGHRQHRGVDLSQSKRVCSWELILVSVLAVAGLVAMFWQLLRVFVQ